MHLRIATDQPWDVAADVLAAPYVGEPAFDGPLGELDRRSGGELAALAAFGELTDKRYSATLAAAGELPVGRLLLVGAGDADKLDRETIHRLGATIERRLGGRKVSRLAVWIGDLAGRVDGGAATVVELLVRGVIEGHYEPKGIYLETVEAAPPVLDELIVVAPGGDAVGLAAAAERGRIMGEGANTARNLANRASNDVSPEVLADEAAAIAERNGLWIDVIEPDRAQELGMGMFIAVGRGSDNPPRMIVLRSGKPGEKDSLGRHLAIVGKGVCFDSGG
ncbi:MAG: M17 family peptidase N-terminal domain-containing protein, partial [Candidatus Limnocylindrales bacterium]